MNEAYGEILTVEEAAEYLRIPVSTVYRLAQQGRMPACKVGRQWRFFRPKIQQWISQYETSELQSSLPKAKDL